jgi:hypothetical protein
MQRIGDIELDQDLPFERAQWITQRFGWALFALFVLAATLGLFGGGPLSAATAGGDGVGLTIGYERFVRLQGQGELNVELAGNQAVNGELELWIDTAYLGAVTIGEITPAPVEVRSDGDRLVHVFAVDDPAQPVRVSISYVPQEIGRLAGAIGVNGGPAIEYTQFSYP